MSVRVAVMGVVSGDAVSFSPIRLPGQTAVAIATEWAPALAAVEGGTSATAT